MCMTHVTHERVQSAYLRLEVSSGHSASNTGGKLPLRGGRSVGLGIPLLTILHITDCEIYRLQNLKDCVRGYGKLNEQRVDRSEQQWRLALDTFPNIIVVA